MKGGRAAGNWAGLVPIVDGALSTQPEVQAAPPVRNTSASSMQSPPARAEATSAISLVAGVGPARGIAQVEVLLEQLGRAQVLGQCGRKE